MNTPYIDDRWLKAHGESSSGDSDQPDQAPHGRAQPAFRPFQYSLRTMLLLFLVLASSLAVFGAGGIVVFALVTGLAIYLHQVESFWSLARLALVLLCLMFLIALLLPAVEIAREASRRMQCSNNLKQIGLALYNYHQANGCFPPAYIADKTGKPMHSWRVLLLPYLEEVPLYATYSFSEPWDGPNNRKLLAARPWGYTCPSDSNAHAPGAAQTSYVAVVGPNAAWLGDHPRKAADFPGGAGNTIMLVEVANSGIPWTQPRDLSLDTLGVAKGKSPALAVSSEHTPREEFFYIYDRSAGANVAMADGSVRYLPPGTLSIVVLRKALQVGGYTEEQIGSHTGLYDEQRRLNWSNIAAVAVWLLSVVALLHHAVRSRTPSRQPAVQPQA